MDRWSDGRVTLVGDAGYSPGPAVGGGTSLAVIGAYLLAAALRDAGRDHVRAFNRYQDTMREPVARSRRIAPATMKTLIPATRRQVWLTIQSMRLIPRLPTTIQRRPFAFHGTPATALESVTLPTQPQHFIGPPQDR